MTNKVQIIREEVEKLKSNLVYGACSSQVAMETHCKEEAYNEVLAILDSMQEETVSIWHDVSKETPIQGSNILMIRKEEGSDFPPIAGCFRGTNSRLDGRNWGYYNGFCYNEIEPPLKWAYVDDLLNLSNIKRTVKDCKEHVSEDLENAAEDYCKSTLVGSHYIKKNAFKAGAKWQEEKDDEEKVLTYKHGFEDCKEMMMAKGKLKIHSSIMNVMNYKY